MSPRGLREEHWLSVRWRIGFLCRIALAAVLMGSLVAAPAPSAADDLVAARAELAHLQERYGDKHPKVIEQQLRG